MRTSTRRDSCTPEQLPPPFAKPLNLSTLTSLDMISLYLAVHATVICSYSQINRLLFAIVVTYLPCLEYLVFYFTISQWTRFIDLPSTIQK